MIRRLTLSTLVFMCVGCGSTGSPVSAPSSLSGTATWRERMALPPDAVFEATLEDVSRADAPSILIASTRIDSPGNPPIRFTLDYERSKLVERHRYVVRAKITRGDELMFATDTAYPVLEEGQQKPLELLLKRAGTSAPAAANTIEDVEWNVTRIGETPVVANPQNVPRLLLQSSERRLIGSGGCNRLAGGYTLSGQTLKFGNTISTMMACPTGMEQERALHDALAKVTSWRMNGAALELLDSAGQPVVTLVRGQ